MNALSLGLPVAVAQPPTAGVFNPCWRRWWVVVLYALAMAWVESAVVFYLRYHMDRLVPYQPNPLPEIGGFALAEIVREAATMIMLATVGCLAGTTWRSRFAFALLAFGIWDVAYYVWLVPLTGWPQSILDWDILFLIPLPWWGPVWAPASIAVLMILFGTIVGIHDSAERPLWPGKRGSAAAIAGILLALYVFMADSIRVALSGGNVEQLRNLLPQHFNWPLFLMALGLMMMPVLSAYRRARCGATQHGLDCEKWIEHFMRNRAHRVEPDWSAPVALPVHQLTALLPSIEQFQLGDGGGECRLIAFNADRFTGQTAMVRQLVDLWFAEEAEHSRLLGCAVDRLGGERIKSHWSFTAFCEVRRRLGVQFELQVLTLTELVSTAYYRVLRRHVDDAPLRAMCSLILRDEAGHVAFHRERLAVGGSSHRLFPTAAWRAQFWFCGHAAATVLWISHRRCLRALGGSRAEYFGEVRRELSRFIAAMLAHRRKLNSVASGQAMPDWSAIARNASALRMNTANEQINA